MKRNLIKTIIIILLIITNTVFLYMLMSKDDQDKTFNISKIDKTLFVQINEPISMYKGIRNLLSIEGQGVIESDYMITIENGKVNYLPEQKIFEIYMNKVGNTKLRVFKNNNGDTIKLIEKQIRVTNIPNPVSYIAITDTLSTQVLLNRGKITSHSSINYMSEQTYEITNHTLVANVNNIERIISNDNESFNEEQIELIKQLKPGQHLIIKNIKVLMPDSTIRDLDPLVITIRK